MQSLRMIQRLQCLGCSSQTFYDWPHIQFFDDVNDLVSKLTTTDFKALSMAMARENVIRETVLLEQWCCIIRNSPD